MIDVSKKIKNEKISMKEHEILWNRFIEEVYDSFLDYKHSPSFDNKNTLFSAEQKNAIIAFAYDAEINSGGHITFFDSFANTFSIEEVANALRNVGGEKFASNFLSAASHIHYVDELGYMDDVDSVSDPIEDIMYYSMNPPLPHLLQNYIFDNKLQIFR